MQGRASIFGLLRPGLACLVLATVAAGLGSPAQAECILQPNQQAPDGSHWSLHLDRAKNRRCWVLVDGSGRDISAAPVEPEAPSFWSFQWLTDSFVGGPPPAVPSAQEAPAAVPAAPPRQPAPRVAAGTRPAVARAKSDAHPAGRDMTPEERDALFEEFLRWHESQQVTGSKEQPR